MSITLQNKLEWLAIVAAIALVLTVAITGCGDQAPRNAEVKPAPKAPAPATAAQPAPKPAPEAKPSAAPAPNPTAELAARVKKALEAEAVQAAGIDVTASGDGVVSLWGTVTSNDERARAARIASKVEGVKAVENKLAVVKGS